MTAEFMRMCLYDADCGICTFLVQRCQRLDRGGRIEFVPNYEEGRFPQGVTQLLVRETIVVVEPGRPGLLLRAAAVASILRALPPFAPLGWFLQLPGVRFLSDKAYRLVARNRMHISRAFGLGVCKVPQPGGPTDGRGE